MTVQEYGDALFILGDEYLPSIPAEHLEEAKAIAEKLMQGFIEAMNK